MNPIHVIVAGALWCLSGIVQTERAGRHAVKAGRRSYMAAKDRSRSWWTAGMHSFSIAPGDNHHASRIIESLRRERLVAA